MGRLCRLDDFKWNDSYVSFITSNASNRVKFSQKKYFSLQTVIYQCSVAYFNIRYPNISYKKCTENFYILYFCDRNHKTIRQTYPYVIIKINLRFNKQAYFTLCHSNASPFAYVKNEQSQNFSNEQIKYSVFDTLQCTNKKI